MGNLRVYSRSVREDKKREMNLKHTTLKQTVKIIGDQVQGNIQYSVFLKKRGNLLVK
jgi:hypothetical protein